MTTFGPFTGVPRFQLSSELDCGLCLPGLTGSSTGSWKTCLIYVPKRFQEVFLGADQAQRGKVIEFRSRFWRGQCVAPVRHSAQPHCK